MKKQNINYSQLIAATLLLLILGISVAYFTPAIAQGKKSDKKTESEGKTTTKEKTIIKVIDDEGNVKTYTSKEDVPEKIRKQLDEEDAVTRKESYTISKTFDLDDLDALGDQIDDEMKKVDVDKIVNEALAEVDWKQINAEIANASKSHNKAHAEAMVSAEEAMKEVRKAMKEVDWEEARKEMREGMKEAEKAMAQINWAEIRNTVNESMMEARAAAATAAASAAQAHCGPAAPVATDRLSFDKMLDKMEADGLIDRADGFKIKKKGERLFINGEEQYDDIFNKYKAYLKGDIISIKGHDDNLSVSITN